MSGLSFFSVQFDFLSLCIPVTLYRFAEFLCFGPLCGQHREAASRSAAATQAVAFNEIEAARRSNLSFAGVQKRTTVFAQL